MTAVALPSTKEFLQSATSALRQALKEKPELVRKIRPGDTPYRVSFRDEVFNSSLLSYWGAWDQGIVIFTSADGEVTVGARFPSDPTDPYVAGDLTEGEELDPFIKGWLSHFYEKGAWLRFLDTF